ncbi:hypothetical protein MNBD_PLANCTO03-2120 [hydrothermal vent metagenome]|uniref:RNA polymerase sigma-70 region 2 domain-containing protein n=1 Tax=hydrothermal vent metagenome TaxID=652676 RepID=A0A3B1DWT4_9ZZZZ
MATGLCTTTTTLLLERLHDPQEQAIWTEFDARYRPILIGVGVRLGLNADMAAEAAQETLVQFLADYRDGRYSREQGRLRAWLIGICRHRVMDVHRRHARAAGGRGESVLAQLPDAQAISATWDIVQSRVIFERAMEVLREGGRIAEQTVRVFELVALKGVPATSVAATTGIEVAEVYRIKHRVTTRLREIVEQLTKAYATEG